MPALDRIREGLYEGAQRALSAWARWRNKSDFDRVEKFCLFIGYPRSGHSIVGALLNAHPNAVISHELVVPPLILGGLSRDDLYARILARAWWFDMRGNRANYSYAVPGQWQGRFDTLRVIGDKRGGAVSRCIEEHPDFLPRTRSLVGIPLRLIHVVRNPFDNISAISIGHGLSLEEGIEFYFQHTRTTARLDALCEAGEVSTVHHEDMVRDPAIFLSGLCGFLGITPIPGYLEACGSVVFRNPTYTRLKSAWTPALVGHVEARLRTIPFLSGYRFEIPEGGVRR